MKVGIAYLEVPSLPSEPTHSIEIIFLRKQPRKRMTRIFQSLSFLFAPYLSFWSSSKASAYRRGRQMKWFTVASWKVSAWPWQFFLSDIYNFSELLRLGTWHSLIGNRFIHTFFTFLPAGIEEKGCIFRVNRKCSVKAPLTKGTSLFTWAGGSEKKIYRDITTGRESFK